MESQTMTYPRHKSNVKRLEYSEYLKTLEHIDESLIGFDRITLYRMDSSDDGIVLKKLISINANEIAEQRKRLSYRYKLHKGIEYMKEETEYGTGWEFIVVRTSRDSASGLVTTIMVSELSDILASIFIDNKCIKTIDIINKYSVVLAPYIESMCNNTSITLDTRLMKALIKTTIAYNNYYFDDADKFYDSLMRIVRGRNESARFIFSLEKTVGDEYPSGVISMDGEVGLVIPPYVIALRYVLIRR